MLVGPGSSPDIGGPPPPPVAPSAGDHERPSPGSRLYQMIQAILETEPYKSNPTDRVATAGVKILRGIEPQKAYTVEVAPSDNTNFEPVFDLRGITSSHHGSHVYKLPLEEGSDTPYLGLVVRATVDGRKEDIFLEANEGGQVRALRGEPDSLESVPVKLDALDAFVNHMKLSEAK